MNLLQFFFERRKKQYIKNIFFIIEEMKVTLSDYKNQAQWIMDTKIYAIPRNNNGFKLLIIIAFNKLESKSKSSCIVLIKNENCITYINISTLFVKKIYF